MGSNLMTTSTQQCRADSKQSQCSDNYTMAHCTGGEFMKRIEVAIESLSVAKSNWTVVLCIYEWPPKFGNKPFDQEEEECAGNIVHWLVRQPIYNCDWEFHIDAWSIVNKWFLFRTTPLGCFVRPNYAHQDRFMRTIMPLISPPRTRICGLEWDTQWFAEICQWKS